MSKIYPILLAGGSGTRLWPVSRKSLPKQFTNLLGKKTLFQTTVERLTSSNLIDFYSHVILTNSDYRFIVREQLQNIGAEQGQIIIEPEAKNTAPAILVATLYAHAIDPNSILLVSPSDHIIPDTLEFHKAIKIGLDQVHSGKIVTFGISPTRPETGYGYLELKEDKSFNNGVSIVSKFIEKPNFRLAKEMFESKNYLWNAGIFLFEAKNIINAFELFAPEILKIAGEALKNAQEDLGFLRLNSKLWKNLEKISIDYAIMEKIKNIVAVPFSSEWSDMGDWETVWLKAKKDSSGVSMSSDANSIDCSNTLLRSESSSQKIVGLGLKNIIAVATPDAVLVADKSKAQDIKNLVDYLKAKKIPQAQTFPKDYRPWGWFEILTQGDCFQVKRIFVKLGRTKSAKSSFSFRALDCSSR